MVFIIGSVLEHQPPQLKKYMGLVSQPPNVQAKAALQMATVHLVLECVVHSLNLTAVQLFPTIVLTSKTLATPQPTQLVAPANILSLP